MDTSTIPTNFCKNLVTEYILELDLTPVNLLDSTDSDGSCNIDSTATYTNTLYTDCDMTEIKEASNLVISDDSTTLTYETSSISSSSACYVVHRTDVTDTNWQLYYFFELSFVELNCDRTLVGTLDAEYKNSRQYDGTFIKLYYTSSTGLNENLEWFSNLDFVKYDDPEANTNL